jgi:hypothetical protein
MRNSIFAVSLVASLALASVAAHADPVDDTIATAAPAKPQGWQVDLRTVGGVSDTGTGGAAVAGVGVDVGKRTGDFYVGGSADASELALMTPGGWGGSLLRTGVEVRDYVYDQPGIAANCFGTYPVRRELYVGARAGAERAEDTFENEDVGGFGELTFGGTQVSASGSTGFYLSVGASAAPDNNDATTSPATSVYAMAGIQFTFG